ncbi:MAG TPA: hypothetical protein VF977_06780, partial [Candidatus Binatia bacterium]
AKSGVRTRPQAIGSHETELATHNRSKSVSEIVQLDMRLLVFNVVAMSWMVFSRRSSSSC